MQKTTWKSAGAVLAGFISGAVLSVGTDILLSSTNILNMASFKENSPSITLMVIVYRFIYNIFGCYITAKLAPQKPMKHCLILGSLGTIFAIAGSIAMWDKALAWYNISIILISLPSAWIGGKLYLAGKPHKKNTN